MIVVGGLEHPVTAQVMQRGSLQHFSGTFYTHTLMQVSVL